MKRIIEKIFTNHYTAKALAIMAASVAIVVFVGYLGRSLQKHEGIDRPGDETPKQIAKRGHRKSLPVSEESEEEEKEETRSVNDIKKKISHRPDDAALFYELGNQYAIEAQHHLAFDMFRKAAELGYKSTELQTRLATTYRKRGRNDLALKEIEKGLINDPKSNTLKLKKADILLEEGDKKGATDVYHEVLFASKVYKKDLSRFRAAKQTFDLRKSDNALTKLKAELESARVERPSDPFIPKLLGDIRLRLSDRDRAFDYFRDSLRLARLLPSGEKAEALILRAQIAKIFLKEGETEEAQKVAHDIIKEHRGLHVAYNQAADIFIKSGERARGIKILKQGLDDIEDEFIRKLLQNKIKEQEKLLREERQRRVRRR